MYSRSNLLPPPVLRSNVTVCMLFNCEEDFFFKTWWQVLHYCTLDCRVPMLIFKEAIGGCRCKCDQATGVSWPQNQIERATNYVGVNNCCIESLGLWCEIFLFVCFQERWNLQTLPLPLHSQEFLLCELSDYNRG